MLEALKEELEDIVVYSIVFFLMACVASIGGFVIYVVWGVILPFNVI